MSGAIAGTAIFRCMKVPRLQLVALTVNNFCNLRCQHCYLQYDGERDLISPGLVADVVLTKAHHVAIVGKEPLVDTATRRRCEEIVDAAHAAGKTVSLITNGLGLAVCPSSLLRKLDAIDVSFDGGPATYQRYRGVPYDRLERGLAHAVESGVPELNALHVLNSATVNNVEDMMRVGTLAPFRRIMFSLYFESENDGRNSVRPVPLEASLATLSRTASFREHPCTIFLLDIPLLASLSLPEVMSCIAASGLSHKVHLVEADPLLYGIIRVTYDGLALPPLESVHPRRYRAAGIRLQSQPRVPSQSLEEIYRDMLPSAA